MSDPYRTPRAPLQPTAREELERSLAVVTIEQGRMDSAVAALDGFMQAQLAALPRLLNAMGCLSSERYRNTSQIAALVVSTSALLSEAQTARSNLWEWSQRSGADANRIKERLG